jgi:ribosome-associated protein
MIEFELTGEYIELIRLLKYLRLSETGGRAKMMVDEGLVKHNGVIEYRRQAKLRRGDMIEVEGTKVMIK